jgi:COP9 signalosome complex subunit 1
MEAAEVLLQVPAAMGSTYLDVMAPEDVATYGALSALATFDRKLLREKLLENASFRGYLEYVPQVRSLVLDFAQSQYGACLKTLDAIQVRTLHGSQPCVTNQLRMQSVVDSSNNRPSSSGCSHL